MGSLSSFGELLRQAGASRPDDLAVTDGVRRLSWRELTAEVAAAAAGLASYGLAPGDRLVLQAETSPDFVVLYLGGLRAGLVMVPVNPGYTLDELSHIIEDSGARMLITSSVAAVEAAVDLREQHPGLAHVLVAARSGSEDVPPVAQLLADGARAEPVDAERGAEEVAILLYTSGTSGRPKGAMLPARALLANLEQLAALQPAPVTAADTVYVPLPLFHVFGLNAGVGLALLLGAPLVLTPRPPVENGLELVREQGATVIVAAPRLLRRWSIQPDFAASMAGVRVCLAGSAAVPEELVATYAAVGVDLYEGYGLTEASPVVTVNLVPDGNGGAHPKPGFIGRALPGVQVRLVDASGETAEPGDPGLLEVRGENLFLGYWPDGHDGPRADGWFGTGDLAVTDSDSDYRLVGRRADLINVNGFNVYPAEVEAVLSRQPEVREVVVVGEPDPDHGETVVAFVVPEPGQSIVADSLIAAASTSLARFKLPARIVVVDQLPHTVTGKVQRWRLHSAEPSTERP